MHDACAGVLHNSRGPHAPGAYPGAGGVARYHAAQRCLHRCRGQDGTGATHSTQRAGLTNIGRCARCQSHPPCLSRGTAAGGGRSRMTMKLQRGHRRGSRAGAGRTDAPTACRRRGRRTATSHADWLSVNDYSSVWGYTRREERRRAGAHRRRAGGCRGGPRQGRLRRQRSRPHRLSGTHAW